MAVICDGCGNEMERPSSHECVRWWMYHRPIDKDRMAWKVDDLCVDCLARIPEILERNGIKVHRNPDIQIG